MVLNDVWQGDKVRLAALSKADLPRFGELMSNVGLLRFISAGQVFPFTVKNEEDWYNSVREDRDQIVFTVRTLEDDTLLGSCGYNNIRWQARNARVGINLADESRWGQGYGTDAMQVLLRYGFMEMNLHRVSLDVFSYNHRAIASYEKVGYQHEGRLRQTILRDGVYHDTLLMGILRNEWLALQADDAKG